MAREEWDPGYGMHFSLTSCVTLESCVTLDQLCDFGNLSSLSETQFPHL